MRNECTQEGCTVRPSKPSGDGRCAIHNMERYRRQDVRNECTQEGCTIRPSKPSGDGRCAKHSTARYYLARNSTFHPDFTDAYLKRLERNEQIIQRFLDGASTKELAKAFNVHINTVQNMIREYRSERIARDNVRIQNEYRRVKQIDLVSENLSISQERVRQAVDTDLRLEVRDSLRHERFMERITEVDGCWFWLGGLSGRGYGAYLGTYAHRYSYEMHYGKIPEGKQIHHKCGNTICVNPEHLEVVTQQENLKIRNGPISLRGRGFTEWKDYAGAYRTAVDEMREEYMQDA